MPDNEGAQEQQWLASVLPSQQQLDRRAGQRSGRSIARSREEPRTDRDRLPSAIPAMIRELKKEFAMAQAAAAALKQDGSATLSADQTQALHAFVHLLARPALRVVDGGVPGDSAVVGAAQDGA